MMCVPVLFSFDARNHRCSRQDAVETLFGGRTVLLIAHRLSTVQHADKIIVLENGAVTQIGTHAGLSAERGLYRELVDLQTRTPVSPR